MENTGSLVINKLTKTSKNIKNGSDVKDLFLKAIKGSVLHQPIQLIDYEGNVSKVHHLGLLAVLDQSNPIGSSFIDDARVEIANALPLQGTVFTGYLEEKNDYSVSTYTFFKTEALPERLAVGLEMEYNEFMKKQSNVNYAKAAISSIAASEEDDFDIDLNDLGIDLGLDEEKQDSKLNDISDDIDISKIDLSILDED